MHKNIIYLTVIFYIFNGLIYPQVTLSDFNKEIDKIKEDMKLDIIEGKEVSSEKVDPDIEEIVLTPEIIEVDIADEYFFGYDYFRREINFFDNIPTPLDFKLGPGDEITLSMWGVHNSQENLTINKEGLIYYSNVGFINLSNKSLSEAEEIFREKLSKIYSTLNDDKLKTELTIELSKIRSTNIYFSGEVFNPGVHLIHPFSDIFSAIAQSGGIKDYGSLRKIQLIREGNTIAQVDFYSFFINGVNSFSSIRLLDGDVIHIPPIENRVRILGEINRPGYYEILDGESVEDLIIYAAGLTSMASSTMLIDKMSSVKSRDNDDSAFSSKNIYTKMANLEILNHGDKITVNTLESSDSKVLVIGKVKIPGEYSAINATLKDVLDFAGGFEDPIFSKMIDHNIIVLRNDETQFNPLEFSVKYEDADSFKLEVNDKIFVYENSFYENSPTFKVEGEFLKPGTYPLTENLTVQEAIDMAGGLTPLTSEKNIILIQEYTSLSGDGTSEISEQIRVNNLSLDFIISNNSVIKALPYENVVRVEGNVYEPGLIAYETNLTIYKAIIQAGGYMPNSLKKRVYVRSLNGSVHKTNIFRGRVKRLTPGDTIVVPVNLEPKEFDITAFVADLSTTLANIAAILLVVDNANN